MVSEFRETSKPAYYIRPWLQSCGINVQHDHSQGATLTVSNVQISGRETSEKVLSSGVVDPAPRLGLKALETRNYTSALAWGVAKLRLLPEMENMASSYAAIWLCREDQIRSSPLLDQIRAGHGGALEKLAEELLVAPWCVAEAILAYGLSDRVLVSVDPVRAASPALQISHLKERLSP
jgi:hypothetical protein